MNEFDDREQPVQDVGGDGGDHAAVPGDPIPGAEQGYVEPVRREREEPPLVERTLRDGSVTPMAIYRPKGDPKAIVVLFPGFGMGARYYWPMAQELRDRGYAVLVSELRGQGGQTARATRKSRWGYHDLASVDFPAAVAEARAQFEKDGERLPLYLMCHSMGGQIGGLYLARPEADVDGMITIGSGTPHYIRFEGKEFVRLCWGGPVMWVVATLLGYWPAGPWDLARYGRQSGRHVREWAMFARNGRLRPRNADVNYERLTTRVTTPVLMLSCDGDRDCTPASAIDLASRLPRAARYEFIDERLGHNRWAREPEAVCDRLDRWLTELSDDATIWP
ncbi:alpha/beta fold hydrolase [uncultured Corynebacterium sp.]|uniref:alpha/beta fold hydrolase n=1 Tax=uncultured Corynebacterium sp. TaxID=159447 RepID=UPI002602B79D|nr:alpha/beta fold hydrolase [uncultured Corynebacterium sp.]